MSEKPVHLPELRDQLRTAAMETRQPHARRVSRSPRAFAGATLAAAIAAVIAFIIGAGSDPRATADPVRSDGTLLNSRFAVFDRTSDSGDPGNPFATTASPQLLDPMAPDGRLAVDPGSVHRIALPGQNVWVAANSRKVCISAPPQAKAGATRVACARPAQILEAGLFLWGRPTPRHAGGVEIAGLLPDGVDAATIVLDNGVTVDAKVSDNGLAASLPSTPARVRFRDETGNQHNARL